MVEVTVAGIGKVKIYFLEDQPSLIGLAGTDPGPDTPPPPGFKFPDGNEPDYVDRPTKAVKLWIDRTLGFRSGQRLYGLVVLNGKTVLTMHGQNLCGEGRLNGWCRSLH
jgi:hypothetical protein